jgi:iron complex transport system substrate-binding protein
LGADAADILHELGAWTQVIGVTAFYPQPAGAEAKPRVSGFSTGQASAILELAPDLVITSSDVQHDLAAQVIRAGVRVCALQAHTLADIYANIRLLGRIVNRAAAAEELVRRMETDLARVEPPGKRPRVYFEEWADPLITGIGWVSELIERAGGTDIFPELHGRRKAPERCVEPAHVIARAPDLIVASWCGKPADFQAIAARPGWCEIPATRAGRLIEIPSDDILQAGPRICRGYAALKAAIVAASSGQIVTNAALPLNHLGR